MVCSLDRCNFLTGELFHLTPLVMYNTDVDLIYTVIINAAVFCSRVSLFWLLACSFD